MVVLYTEHFFQCYYPTIRIKNNDILLEFYNIIPECELR